MKTNHKLIMKLISLGLLVVITMVFTQCVPTNTQQIGNAGKSLKDSFQTPPKPKDEAQIINQTQVSTGIKSFEQIFHTMSVLTGVSVTDGSVLGVYRQVETTLPTDNDIKVFLAPHQLAVTKLAAEFCHRLVDNTTLRARIWPDFEFNATPANALNMADRDMMIEQTIEAFWGGIISDDERMTARDEFHQLIDELLVDEANSSTVTRNIMKGVCTTALSSAHVTLI